MKRIEFVKKTGAAALLLSMGISITSCNDESEEISPTTNDYNNGNQGAGSKTSTISLSLDSNPYDVLKNQDSWLLIRDNNILVVNVGGNIRAFTSVCTHSGCNDNWSYSNREFTCNCHGSKFNNSGEVVQGPASRNLTEYSVSSEGSKIEIAI